MSYTISNLCIGCFSLSYSLALIILNFSVLDLLFFRFGIHSLWLLWTVFELLISLVHTYIHIDCDRLSLYKTYVFSNFKFRYLQQAAMCNVKRKLYYTAQSLVLDLQYASESFSNSLHVVSFFCSDQHVLFEAYIYCGRTVCLAW